MPLADRQTNPSAATGGRIYATGTLQAATAVVESLDNRSMTSTASRLSTMQREIEHRVSGLNPDARQRVARERIAIAEPAIDEADRQTLDIRSTEREAQAQIDELELELAEVRKRPDSNLPPAFQQLRSSLAETLDIAEAPLPFVAELVQIKEADQRWCGAIEEKLMLDSLLAIRFERIDVKGIDTLLDDLAQQLAALIDPESDTAKLKRTQTATACWMPIRTVMRMVCRISLNWTMHLTRPTPKRSSNEPTVTTVLQTSTTTREFVDDRVDRGVRYDSRVTRACLMRDLLYKTMQWYAMPSKAQSVSILRTSRVPGYETFDTATVQALRDLGHMLRDNSSEIGSVQAVQVDETSDAVTAGADGRRPGTVAGIPWRSLSVSEIGPVSCVCYGLVFSQANRAHPIHQETVSWLNHSEEHRSMTCMWNTVARWLILRAGNCR